jgi:uncharacterized protein (UPF0335 family)
MEELDNILDGITDNISDKQQVQEENETQTQQTQQVTKPTDREMQEQFLINKDEEETKLTLEYARRMIALEKEIKEIKDDMKAIKNEYKDEGVSVQKVNKAIKNIKMAAKLNDLDATEIEMIQTVLNADPDIHTEIAQLVSKD